VLVLLSCSRESTPPLWEPQTELNSKEYKGGLFPVWITLKEPTRGPNIRWHEGNAAKIAYRKQGKDPATNLIKADTAFFYWDNPPQPFIKIDSTEITIDAAKSWKYDTTFFYRDTVYAIVNGVESEPIVIEIKNILPRIKSISVGDVSQPGDSLLTIAANPGVELKIAISLEKTFNKANRARVEMPREIKGLSLDIDSTNDSLWVYKWKVPPIDTIADSSMYIKIKDSGGFGERLYKVYLVIYTEVGSVWVAAEKELAKYTSMGVEVAKISGFGNISDIAVNSTNRRLFVADKDSNAVYIYDTNGKKLSSNALFDNPTSVAIDVVGNYAWVADAQGLQSFKVTGDAISTASESYSMDGPIKGLSIDQFQKDFVWFARPENDAVGFIKNKVLEYIDINWNRPEMVSYHNGIAWIADSARVVAVNENGEILAKISGFEFVGSISADAKGVWVSDIYASTVYRFQGTFNGSTLDITQTVANGMALKKFISPIFVSALISDGSAWIIDRDAGMAVRYDALGNEIATGTVDRPYLGKTIQEWE